MLSSVCTSPIVDSYAKISSSPIDTIKAQLLEDTMNLGGFSAFSSSILICKLLKLLVSVTNATQILEVGTFTGLSALYMAEALPAHGRLICLDISTEWTTIAQKTWTQAGVAEKIHLILGPAISFFKILNQSEFFDLSYVDADKENYLNYYEEILPRTKPNGLIIFDDTLYFGRVCSDIIPSRTTAHFRELNKFLAADSRVETILLPVVNGLTICRKLS